MEVRKQTKQKKRNSFYPRKLVGSGGTRTLAIGHIVPKDWQMVKVSVVRLEDSICILQLERII